MELVRGSRPPEPPWGAAPNPTRAPPFEPAEDLQSSDPLLKLPSLTLRVLYLMTKNNYKAPTLKNKSKWTSKFHQFLKDCLVKNPRRRPTADKLLYVSTG